MAVRVEITQAAADDLRSYLRSGNLSTFIKKLLRLEEIAEDAGQPLRGNLTGWRKVVVGDRNWRILFAMNVDRTVATVWVVGDRDDAECYRIAERRLTESGSDSPAAASLATVMFDLAGLDRKRRDR